MLAVSKRLIPASRHISTCLLAPETSVAPTLLKPPCPPKVIVPRVSAETNKPERPRRRYSIGSSLRGWTNNVLASLARCVLRCGVMQRLSQPHRFPHGDPSTIQSHRNCHSSGKDHPTSGKVPWRQECPRSGV